MQGLREPECRVVVNPMTKVWPATTAGAAPVFPSQVVPSDLPRRRSGLYQRVVGNGPTGQRPTSQSWCEPEHDAPRLDVDHQSPHPETRWSPRHSCPGWMTEMPVRTEPIFEHRSAPIRAWRNCGSVATNPATPLAACRPRFMEFPVERTRPRPQPRRLSPRSPVVQSRTDRQILLCAALSKVAK